MDEPGLQLNNSEPSLTARKSSISNGHRKSSRRVIPPKFQRGHIRNSYSGCYVLRCKMRNCTVQTHRKPSEKRNSNGSNSDNIPKQRKDRVGRADLSRKLVPLPSFSDPMLDDAEFKNLFHQYLSFDMPRIVALMAPPPSTMAPEQDTKLRQHGIANLGLLAPVYFLLFVTMGHILELVRREKLEPDKVSARLYGRLMQVLRQKLDNYKHTEAPNLALAVIALSSFDMSLGNMSAVKGHRIAMQHLVAHAGMPYLGRSLPYVLSFDRIIAAFTGEPPLYAKMPDRKFLRKPTHPKKYGIGFQTSKQKLRLDADVENLCDDVCRAVEIAEAENWTFRPERLQNPFKPSDVQYLYFMREVIQNTCANLQARDLQNPDISKPIVLAAMIVQYNVLGKNDLPWYSTSAADRLYRILLEQNLAEVWYGIEEVLCWLMCVMMIVRPWQRHKYALTLFTQWLETTDPINPKEDERGQMSWDGSCDPQSFMWCKSEFDNRLAAALKNHKSRFSSISCIRDDEFPDSPSLIVSCSTRTSSEDGDGLHIPQNTAAEQMDLLGDD